jgi:hypothetical protein
MQLRDALDQISLIREHLARTQTFRGYRWASTTFSGVVAVVAAGAQYWWIPDPRLALAKYLAVWLIAALVSVIAVGVEMAWRMRRTPEPLQRELSFAAIEQFIPCMVTGALVTYVVMQFATEFAWALPGLWMIFFGLGILASRRLLTRPIVFVGAYYLLAGLCVMTLRRELQFSPWTMGGVFGVGQLAAAAVLYWTLERREHERVE